VKAKIQTTVYSLSNLSVYDVGAAASIKQMCLKYLKYSLLKRSYSCLQLIV